WQKQFSRRILPPLQQQREHGQDVKSDRGIVISGSAAHSNNGRERIHQSGHPAKRSLQRQTFRNHSSQWHSQKQETQMHQLRCWFSSKAIRHREQSFDALRQHFVKANARGKASVTLCGSRERQVIGHSIALYLRRQSIREI